MATNTCFGIGSDNFLVVQPCNREVLETINTVNGYWDNPPSYHKADLIFRMFEPNGNEAYSCGNGLICIAKHLYLSYGIKSVRILTEIPTKRPNFVAIGMDRQSCSSYVNLGHPRRMPDDMAELSIRKPVSNIIDFVDVFKINRCRKTDWLRFFTDDSELNINGYMVFTGEPHLVLFTESGFSLEELPKLLFPSSTNGNQGATSMEKRFSIGEDLIKFIGNYFVRDFSSIFPKGININFVGEVTREGVLEQRCFERGINKETLACGTGAVACAFVSQRLGMVNASQIRVRPFLCRQHDENAEIVVQEKEVGWQLSGHPQFLIDGVFAPGENNKKKQNYWPQSIKINPVILRTIQGTLDSSSKFFPQKAFIISLLLSLALMFSVFFNVTALDKSRHQAVIENIRNIGEKISQEFFLYADEMNAGFRASLFDFEVNQLLTDIRSTVVGLLAGSSGVNNDIANFFNVSLISENEGVLHTSAVPSVYQSMPEGIVNFINRSGSGMEEVTLNGTTCLINTIGDRNHACGKALVIAFNHDELFHLFWKEASGLASQLIFAFLSVFLFLFIASCMFMPLPSDLEKGSTFVFTFIIIIICMIAQLLYSSWFLFNFRQDMIDQERSGMLLFQKDIENQISKFGISAAGVIDGESIDRILNKNLQMTPSLKSVSVIFDHSQSFHNAQKTIVEDLPESLLWILQPLFPEKKFTINDSFSTFRGMLGHISIVSKTGPLINRFMNMAMDCLTISVITIILSLELLLFLYTFFSQSPILKTETEQVNYKMMRPAIFLLLFAIDLSISFIPLHMEKLYKPLFGMSKSIVMGLPITTEFILVGLAILISGFWVDRRGWHEAFFIGLLLSIFGIFYSFLAPGPLHFILARAFVGAGYGLALMASQGYVIRFTDSKTKAHGLAYLFAGIYSGSICGGATGAMIADRYGYHFVFLIGGVMLFFVIAYTMTFMRSAMLKPMSVAATSLKQNGKRIIAESGFVSFFKNRIVISLIFFSSLPASIAVVGFLNYFIPVYLNRIGVAQSNIGRALMIYGVTLVFLGPLIGKYVDQAKEKKYYVFIGGILGASTFMVFHFMNGFSAAMVALLLLGISSSFVLTAQSAYLLDLNVTRNFGEGKSIGIFRSSGRIGQALGPLVFGSLMVAGDMENGIEMFGMFYLATVFIFLLFTNRDQKVLLYQ
ncbi:MAG: MFS transporter [Desulfobacterales bacterium]|nr:MFS transporter [Desulfobacterales bacterium]